MEANDAIDSAVSESATRALLRDLDAIDAIDSAVSDSATRAFLPRVLFFCAVLAGFFCLGMATANADDGGRDGPSPPSQSTTPEPVVSEDSPLEPAQPAESEQPTDPAEPADLSELKPASEPAEPTSAPESQDLAPEPDTVADPGPSTSSEAPEDNTRTAPIPEGRPTTKKTSDGGEPRKTKGETRPANPVSKTAENVDDLVGDKPERLKRAVKRTVDGTTEVLAGSPTDRTLTNATRTITDPLLREVADTLSDTHRFLLRETETVKRSVTNVTAPLGLDDLPQELPIPGSSTPAPGAPDQETLGRGPTQQTPLMTGMPGVGLHGVGPQTHLAAPALLVPDAGASDAASTSDVSIDAAASSAAPKLLDIAPAADCASATAGTTSGGSGVAPAAFNADRVFLSDGAGHQTVAPAVVVSPRKVSRQPGFVPD